MGERIVAFLVKGIPVPHDDDSGGAGKSYPANLGDSISNGAAWPPWCGLVVVMTPQGRQGADVTGTARSDLID